LAGGGKAAGALLPTILTGIAAEFDVNRKTIRRRLDAAELADAERARRTAARRSG
jgi:hypothetical protein